MEPFPGEKMTTGKRLALFAKGPFSTTEKKEYEIHLTCVRTSKSVPGILGSEASHLRHNMEGGDRSFISSTSSQEIKKKKFKKLLGN